MRCFGFQSYEDHGRASLVASLFFGRKFVVYALAALLDASEKMSVALQRKGALRFAT